MTPDTFMQAAISEAQLAEAAGEVPVGAVIVHDGAIIGRGHNAQITLADPSAHAEINALRDAAKTTGNYRLTDCDIYVTIEPCTMCAGALVHARIRRLVYGTPEPRAGAVASSANVLENAGLNHRVEVISGVLQQECAALMTGFFRRRR